MTRVLIAVDSTDKSVRAAEAAVRLVGSEAEYLMINVAPDPNETCNRTLTVYGMGGKVPRGGTSAQPMDLFVGNAGTEN